jgi:hypothetical protein
MKNKSYILDKYKVIKLNVSGNKGVLLELGKEGFVNIDLSRQELKINKSQYTIKQKHMNASFDVAETLFTLNHQNLLESTENIDQLATEVLSLGTSYLSSTEDFI